MDLYEKLGVPADADLASIKKAYQRLSLQVNVFLHVLGEIAVWRLASYMHACTVKYRNFIVVIIVPRFLRVTVRKKLKDKTEIEGNSTTPTPGLSSF